MLDFYDIDSALTEEERAVRDTVRRLVDERVLPIIGERYVAGPVPEGADPGRWPSSGVFGANLPEEYGCAGLNNVAYGLIMQELERGDSGIRSFASVQGALVMYPIYAFGSEEQKQQLAARRWPAGEVIGCFGLTEPDFGSNPGGMITHGAGDRRTAGCSTAPRCGSPTGRTATRRRSSGPRPATIERREVDPRVHRPDRHQGLHREGPEGEALAAGLGHERAASPGRASSRRTRSCPKSGGLKSPLMCLTQARYGIAWGAVGAAMACYEEALALREAARDVRQADRRSSRSSRCGSPTCSPRSPRRSCSSLQLGRLKDAGTFTPQQVSLAKRNNVNIATDIAREARRLLGANGILAEYSSMRHLANLEIVYTYEGTHDMHSLILGQAVTGLNAFK